MHEGRVASSRIGAVAPPTRSELRRRLPQLVFGLTVIAFGVALMVRSELGLAPYEVLHQGLSKQLGISIGSASIGVGVMVLLAWIPLRQWPGPGTVVNVVLVGLLMDRFLAIIPPSGSLGLRAVELTVGIALLGLGIGLYIGAGLGPGPRDGLMTGLADRGLPLWVVRGGLELTALVVGWSLGGTVGVGTVFVAVAIGPMAHMAIHRFRIPVT